MLICMGLKGTRTGGINPQGCWVIAHRSVMEVVRLRVCLGCSQATAVKSHSSQAQSSREQVETEEIEVKLNRDARCQ